MNINWLRQTDRPLFEDLIWNKPETKSRAGKLLVIGGHSGSIEKPNEAYQTAVKARVGRIKIFLPSSTKKSLPISEDIDFGDSTPSGSFSREALGSAIEYSHWSDAILLCGDIGKNSESAIFLNSLLRLVSKPIILTQDAIDSFYNEPLILFKRPQTTIVVSLGQLQKLMVGLKSSSVILGQDNADKVAENLSELSKAWQANVVLMHNQLLWVASEGRVSATSSIDEKIWSVEVAGLCSVWWLQSPAKPFEALSTAVWRFVDKG